MSFGIPVRNGLGLGLLPSTAVSSLRIGGRPALILDFISTTSLDSRITFTRASTATFVGSNGLIQSAAINAPRFDYNPVTLAPKGLLIEEQRINLLLNSLIDGTSLSTQGVTVTAVAHTISFYGTGTITLTGAHAATVVGTGAYPNRQTLTFTPSAGTLTCTVTGSVQYAQLEAGSFATSYIPTVASQVTRSADAASMTGTNFSSWYNQTQGTFVISGSRFTTTATSNFAAFVSANNSTNANEIYITQALDFGVVAARAFIRSSAGAPGDMVGSAWPLNTVGNAAAAYQLNNAGLSYNGSAVVADTTVGIPTVNRLSIGLRGNNLDWLNGHIRSIAYYNTRLPNATLQALTT